MTRRLPGAMALSFILAASAAGAGPASAAVDLDPTFGDAGVAFSIFDEDTFVASSRVIAGANGEVVTAALTSRSVTYRRADEPDQGLTVTRRSASGEELSAAFFERINGRIPGEIYDMRLMEDGSVIVIGRGAFNDGWDYPHAWYAVVDAQGAVQSSGSTESRDEEACGEIEGNSGIPSGDVVDGGILPSGEVVFAWHCDESGDRLQVVDTAPTSNDQRGTSEPVGSLEWDVDLLDVDAEGRVVYFRSGKGGILGRLERAPKGFVTDPTFGHGESVYVPFQADFLETDAALRPVLAENIQMAPRRSVEGELVFARHEEDGDADPSFGNNGIASYVDDRARRVESLSTDAANRVLFTTLLNGSQTDRGLVRLAENGTPDASFGTNGMQVLDQERMIVGTGPLLGVGDAVYSTLNFGMYDGTVRTTIPAPAGVAALGLARFAVPAPPKTDEQPKTEQPPAATPTQTATSTTVASTSKKTARTCLSRRSFTIRLRPRTLRSATVLVAGKKVKTKRKNGRLTAVVDLRKMQQATFDVAVRGTTRKGKKVTETRTYRTCRVGDSGRKVKGGSIVITVG